MFEHASDMEVASKDEPARGGREAYGGMTLVERLGVAGLLGKSNTAVQQRNREVMISCCLLQRVGLTDAGAAWSADTILAKPERYGY